MRGTMRPVLCLALNALLAIAAGAESRLTRLMGWGGGDPAVIVPAAAEVGFTDIIVWNRDPVYLGKLVEHDTKHGLGTYCSIWLGDLKDWRKRYPDQEPPVQQISAEELALVEPQQAALKAGQSAYQYGGEPVGGRAEVFNDDLLCFHDPRTVELFKAQFRDILSVPGMTGVAFDYFGYRNYRCCRCPRSLALLAEYRQQHPDLTEAAAEQRFSLETLTGVCNELADYARQLKPGCRVTGHVYPVYLPEPLYGNRLNWDTCGQTAAWFFEPFWSYDKIRDYGKVIAEQAKRFFPNQVGAALIGVYVKPGKYPVKGKERLTQEMRAIREGGVTVCQVCSMNDVLNDPDARAVFAAFAPERRRDTD